MTSERSLWYTLDGKRNPVPVDVVPPERERNWRVGFTRVPGAQVSTVFLRLDHRHDWNGPPILFETMVFGGPLDGEQRRYCTWNEARAGHWRMVLATFVAAVKSLRTKPARRF